VQEHLANLISKKVQPPHFARLESLTVVKSFRRSVSVPDDDIIKVVEHLLQNTTPMPRVNITEIYENYDQYFRCLDYFHHRKDL